MACRRPAKRGAPAAWTRWGSRSEALPSTPFAPFAVGAARSRTPRCMADSDAPQRPAPAAPMLVELGGKRATMALPPRSSTNIGATGVMRCEESGSAVHGHGRRVGLGYRGERDTRVAPFVPPLPCALLRGHPPQTTLLRDTGGFPLSPPAPLQPSLDPPTAGAEDAPNLQALPKRFAFLAHLPMPPHHRRELRLLLGTSAWATSIGALKSGVGDMGSKSWQVRPQLGRSQSCNAPGRKTMPPPGKSANTVNKATHAWVFFSVATNAVRNMFGKRSICS